MSVYRSIFQPRSAPVTKGDFDGLALLNIEPDTKTICCWNRHIPVSPQDVDQVFLQNMPQAKRVEIKVDFNSVSIVVVPLVPSAFDATLTFRDGSNPESSLIVQPAHQGNGIGRGWFQAQAELRAALGYSAFRFFAGSLNGAFVWGKAGVALDQDTLVRPYIDAQRHILNGRIDAFERYIDADLIAEARYYAQLDKPDDPANLAALEAPITDDLSDYFAVGKEGHRSLLSHFGTKRLYFESPSFSAVKERVYIQKEFTAAAAAKRFPTFARCLLTGTSQPVRVDYDDLPRMEKIGHYVGGWKTIRPI